ATLVRTNAPRRIDLTTGRPIRGDAPAGATCTTGAGPDCASAGAPEAANPAAFDALCIEETSIFGCPLEFYQDLTTSGFFPVPMTTIFASILAGDNAPATLGGPTWFSALAPTSASFDTAVAAAAPFIAPCATCPPGTTYFDLVSASFRPSTIVALERGPEDGPAALESDYPPGVVVTPGIATLALLSGADPFLSAAQESLFGCGPFFDRSCDILGLHLFHSEAGAVLEALLPAAELRCGRIDAVGTWHVLPGCRGSADPGYDPLVDGSIARVNPYDGSSFRSETGAASWNFSQLQAGISPDLDPLDPFPAAGCNLQFPETCNGAVELLSNSTLTLADDPSGPPQRRWLWELGAEYLVAATSGDLAPYQGWSLFALGPEQPRLAGAQAGVAFLLQAPAGTTVPNTTPFLVRYPGADGATGTPDDPFRGAAYGETP
ncbi:MAG: hypothetical protein GY946_01730, partial [bacterium]|nr:hypothetical protein [bacterium]